MADTPRPTDPPRRALRSSDAELDRAAEITDDDIAALASQAPAAVRKYLTAEPEEPEGGA